MTSDLLASARSGDTRSIARVISEVENRSREGRVLSSELYAAGGNAMITGITGAPGAGKSTLVSALIDELLGDGRLAVVAVDPSSPFTGGAILGDRIRMGHHVANPDVFIRSLANRGSLGGISEATPAVVAAFDALGFAEVLIETVGVGQSEVEIASTADTTVVVVSPGWGDSVQAAKAGLLEVADILVVNKADRSGADVAVDDLETMVAMGPERPWMPPVLRTTALDGEGVATLAGAIREHRAHLAASGEAVERRRRRAAAELSAALQEQMRSLSDASHAETVINRIVERQLDPWSAAASILSSTEER